MTAQGQLPENQGQSRSARLGLSLCFVASSLAMVLGGATKIAAQAAKPVGIVAKPPQGVADIELVERLLATRREYRQALEKLRLHYLNTGDIEKARWAEEELMEYHRIAKQPYRLELDVPPPTLQPSQNIPEANKIYQRAMTYKDKGWGRDYIDNQRRAELLFQQIL